MPLRVRIAGLLIAAGSFGPAAADQPDTVKAVTPEGAGVLTKCRGWIVTSSCRTYHHISLPSRICEDPIPCGLDPRPASGRRRGAALSVLLLTRLRLVCKTGSAFQ